MRTLFVDTETSDMWRDNLEDRDPGQPTPVQVAAVLDVDGRTVASLSCIIRQDTWAERINVRIAAGATRIHGITDQMTRDYGIPAQSVYNRMVELAAQSDIFVAHNDVFDLGVLSQLAARLHLPDIRFARSGCTMRLSASALRIPRHNSVTEYKWPNLSEAYTGLTKRTFQHKHDALYDVYACRSVWQTLVNNDHITQYGVLRSHEESREVHQVGGGTAQEGR